MSGSRVVAAVVTWNRKELLARNLRAVMAQTRPVDDILVVDNASTDGTAEMLAAEFPSVRVVRLAGNAGAAGGMHVAVREGLAMGADWLWLMDDDGVPAPGCLAEQLRIAEREDYALCGPPVACIEDADRLAFPPPTPRLSVNLSELRREVGSDFMDFAKPYLWNGTLLRAEVARKAGFPKAEMFIWGEDNEYCERLHSLGYKAGLATLADYWHPASKSRGWWIVDVDIFGLHLRKCLMCDPASPRFEVHARNVGFRTMRYYGFLVVLAVGSIGLLKIGRTQGSQASIKFLRYFVDGVFDWYALPPSRNVILGIVMGRGHQPEGRAPEAG